MFHQTVKHLTLTLQVVMNTGQMEVYCNYNSFFSLNLLSEHLQIGNSYLDKVVWRHHLSDCEGPVVISGILG